MAKRGRSPGFRMSEEHRGKIKNSSVLHALIEHVEGRREMSASQVSAGLGLLRKVLPDLSAVTMQGDEGGGPIIFTTVYEARSGG
jgi:hypothetical protein